MRNGDCLVNFQLLVSIVDLTCIMYMYRLTILHFVQYPFVCVRVYTLHG